MSQQVSKHRHFTMVCYVKGISAITSASKEDISVFYTIIHQQQNTRFLHVHLSVWPCSETCIFMFRYMLVININAIKQTKIVVISNVQQLNYSWSCKMMYFLISFWCAKSIKLPHILSGPLKSHRSEVQNVSMATNIPIINICVFQNFIISVTESHPVSECPLACKLLIRTITTQRGLFRDRYDPCYSIGGRTI